MGNQSKNGNAGSRSSQSGHSSSTSSRKRKKSRTSTSNAGCTHKMSAVLTRVLFILHTAIALWRVWLVYPPHYMYFLCIGVACLLVEMVFTVAVRRGSEYKWFCPSVFFYLLSVVPCLWLLELSQLREFSQMDVLNGGCIISHEHEAPPLPANHSSLNASRSVRDLSSRFVLPLGEEESLIRVRRQDLSNDAKPQSSSASSNKKRNRQNDRNRPSAGNKKRRRNPQSFIATDPTVLSEVPNAQQYTGRIETNGTQPITQVTNSQEASAYPTAPSATAATGMHTTSEIIPLRSTGVYNDRNDTTTLKFASELVTTLLTPGVDTHYVPAKTANTQTTASTNVEPLPPLGTETIDERQQSAVTMPTSHTASSVESTQDTISIQPLYTESTTRLTVANEDMETKTPNRDDVSSAYDLTTLGSMHVMTSAADDNTVENMTTKRTGLDAIGKTITKFGEDTLHVLQDTTKIVDAFLQKLDPENWLLALHQVLLFVLVIGRWLLPKGEITRDQLSQLLLVFIGVGADILEFVTETIDNEVFEVRCNPILHYIIYAVWSGSLIQFTLVMTAAKSRKTRVAFSSERVYMVRGRDNCCTNTIFNNADLWGILVTMLLQDMPFLAFRLYVMIVYEQVHQMMIFFTGKNILVVFLQFYRLVVLQIEHKVPKHDDVTDSELQPLKGTLQRLAHKGSTSSASSDRDIKNASFKSKHDGSVVVKIHLESEEAVKRKHKTREL